MWARVKGRAENALMRLPFKGVYNFRPGLMTPKPGQKHLKTSYRVALVFAPLLKLFFRALTLSASRPRDDSLRTERGSQAGAGDRRHRRARRELTDDALRTSTRARRVCARGRTGRAADREPTEEPARRARAHSASGVDDRARRRIRACSGVAACGSRGDARVRAGHDARRRALERVARPATWSQSRHQWHVRRGAVPRRRSPGRSSQYPRRQDYLAGAPRRGRFLVGGVGAGVEGMRAFVAHVRREHDEAPVADRISPVALLVRDATPTAVIGELQLAALAQSASER